MVNTFLIVLGIIFVVQYSQGAQAIGQEVDLDDDGLMDILEIAYWQEAILLGVGVFANIVAVVGTYLQYLHGWL
jgi:hypothetical protein